MSQSKSPNFLGVMSSEASKSRRERNREAQQQFRRRRQAVETARLQRLKHLEGIIERMSTVIVSFTDRMLHEDVLKQYPALAANAQEVITHVLALAHEAEDADEGTTTEAASPNGRYEFSAAQDSGFSELSFHSGPMQAKMMNANQQSAVFMTHPSSQYPQAMGDPTIAYTNFQDPTLSELPSLPPSTYYRRLAQSHGTLPNLSHQRHSHIDLLTRALTTALQFLSAAGIQQQLRALNARFVAQDTLELDLSGAMGNDDPRPLQPDSWSFVNFFPPGIIAQKGTSAKIRCVFSDGAWVSKERAQKGNYGLQG
ncbi:hypothetical protein HG531_009291 [Fusarium graminearum]|nr:hypothetical protein HG531_009291 [Fusarium graminearum]